MNLNQDADMSLDTNNDGQVDTHLGDLDNDGNVDSMLHWDAESGNYLAVYENDDTNESVSLLYDPYGVLLGAEVVDARGDSQVLDADEAAALVAQSERPQDRGVVSQVPLRQSRVRVEDVTSTEDYREWDERDDEDDSRRSVQQRSDERSDQQSVIQAPTDRSDQLNPDGRPTSSTIESGEPPARTQETTSRTADDGVIGDRTDANFWFKQNTNFTCGPASATQIVEDFTGVDYPNENVLAQYAADKGWLTTQGMQAPYLAQLLTDFGVPSTVQSNQDWDDIARYLQEGRSVVMFVDGWDYWGDPGGQDEVENSAKDSVNHFARIVAIDTNKGVAVLSDSGSPNGEQLEVPLSALEEAWNDVTGHDPATGQPIRGHQLIVSTYADQTKANPAGGDDASSESSDPVANVRDLLAPLRSADAGVDLTGSGEFKLDRPDGLVERLFRNPHGFAVVPLTLALSRIAAAASARRK